MRSKLLLIGLILFTLVNSSCSLISGSADGIYLIPNGYIGDVIIVFNQPNGVTPEIEKGRNVYKIPEDGILKVEARARTGIVNLSYFYVDNNNERQEIKYLRVTGERNPAGEPQNKFGDISQQDYENGTFVMNVGGLGSFNTKQGVVQYTSFIIGTPKDSGHLYDKMQKRISQLQRKFIEQSNKGIQRTRNQQVS